MCCRIDIVECPQAGVAMKMSAESGILHYDRTSHCQITGRSLAEPPATACHVPVFRHAEFAPRVCQVVLIIPGIAGDNERICKAPTAPPQFVAWRGMTTQCNFQWGVNTFG